MADTRFKPGNRFWEARSSHGRNPVFANPEALWNACVEYFEWVDDNPLIAAETVKFQGSGDIMEVPKMRAMTINGMCMFLDITQKTWCEWRKTRTDLCEIMTRAEQVIYEQKFSGAAADLLNPNIIARDLGLAERQVVDSKVTGTLTVDPADLSNSAMEELLAARRKSQSNAD